MKPFYLDDTAALSETIMKMEQAGEGFRSPLLRAAGEGLISAVITTGGAPLPTRCLKLERPTVVLLADDLPTSEGVQDWRQAPKLLRWARVIILHATGGHPMHYAAAVRAAVSVRRVVMVEMAHCHHAGWLALAERVAPKTTVLNIVPPPGDTHPRMASNEVIH